ncbi:MAG: hypothetical protein JJU31_09950 [Wenzhouxiangella sp.]|nr:hypothetical protein [Wenzhouxiangella sp.]
MSRLLLAALVLAASVSALADEKPCLVSFDSAVLNVCSGQVQTIDPALDGLADVARFARSEFRVVKFDRPVGRDQRQALENLGARVLGYAPHHAYLVRMPASLDSAAAAIDGVVWTGPFLPVWKLDINLARDLAGDAGSTRGTNIIREAGLDQLVIGLREGARSRALHSRVEGLAGLNVVHGFSAFDGERLLVSFDRELMFDSVMALAADDAVASISLHWPNEFMNSQGPGLHQSGNVSNRPIYD